MLSLYFIAITPCNKVSEEITALKKHIAAKYFSKAALNAPPHITLFPPFKWETQNEDLIIDSLENFVENKNNFNIVLNGYGSFKSRVIYIKPETSEELNNLQKELAIHLKHILNLTDNQNERAYVPHLTIATRDLKRKYFHEAWHEFKNKNFSAEINVNSVVLLKHNGRCWEVFNNFYNEKSFFKIN